MSEHFLYFTATTGTVHLANFDRHYSEHDAPTLCGRSTKSMTEGDETAAGLLATCQTCKARRHNR